MTTQPQPNIPPPPVKPLGWTFGPELIAAGCGHFRIVWQPDGVIQGRETLTPAENAQLDAVIEAHDPEKPLYDPPVSKIFLR
jgi:hypothetical protein